MADKTATEQTSVPFAPQLPGKPVEHPRLLWQARFSPTGKWLIGVGQDASIARWEVTAATAENPVSLVAAAALAGHQGWITGLAFHPSESQLYTADSWGQLAGYSYELPEAGPPLWQLPAAHDGWIRALAIHPDGSGVASAGNDAVVRLWSTKDGSAIREWAHHSKFMSLAFTPDGKFLVSGDLLGNIRIWDYTSAKLEREINATQLYQLSNNQQCGGVRKLLFNPAGDRLAAIGQQAPTGGFATGIPCILIFDFATGELIRAMAVGDKDDGFAYDALFHPAGFVVGVSSAFPGKGPFWLWRPEEEQPFLVDKKLTNGLSLSLHPDGQHIALVTANSPNGNGRQLKDGEYPGGSARIQLLVLASGND